MTAKLSTFLTVCAAAALVATLPVAADTPGMADTAAPPATLQGCQSAQAGAEAPVLNEAAPLTPVPVATASEEIPGPSPAEYCWIESRWTYAGYCCTKSWGLAAVLRLQDRTCCEISGCRSWQNTNTTSCSGYPCP